MPKMRRPAAGTRAGTVRHPAHFAGLRHPEGRCTATAHGKPAQARRCRLLSCGGKGFAAAPERPCGGFGKSIAAVLGAGPGQPKAESAKSSREAAKRSRKHGFFLTFPTDFCIIKSKACIFLLCGYDAKKNVWINGGESMDGSSGRSRNRVFIYGCSMRCGCVYTPR